MSRSTDAEFLEAASTGQSLTESPAAIRANAMSQIMGAIGVESERDVSLPPVNAVGRRSERRHSFS